MCYRINFVAKKSSQKTIKFTEGRGNVMHIKSAVGGLSVSIGPGLPKDSRMTSFLSHRTNGHAYAAMLRPSVAVCTLCIVAKRCVLQQELLLTAYRKSHMRNRLIPK